MGGHPWVLLLLARGTFSRLEAALATLSALEPSWAWCPGRKGGSWAGQDAALAGKGSGVSCRVQCGFQQPMVGLLSPSPTWVGNKDGVISLHVSCHSWMFPTVFYPAGLLPFPLPPGPWESIPAFNISPSLSAKYYSQGISVYSGSRHPQTPQGHRGTRSCHRAKAGQAGLAAVSRDCRPAHGCRFG